MNCNAKSGKSPTRSGTQSMVGLSKLSVQLENEDVWLTQKQLVELYQTAKSTVSEHIKNIYADEELTPDATVRVF